MVRKPPVLVNKEKNAAMVMVEPIFRQQPQESDKEYTLFLIYRDQQWHERSLRETTAKATNIHVSQVQSIHKSIVEACHKWQWKNRVIAYDLFIQESCSEREEKIRLSMKNDIEMICMRLAKKVRTIEAISSADDLTTDEMKLNMAIVQALVGKENAGKFLLDAYKAIVGQKVTVAAMKRVPDLTWGDPEPKQLEAA